MFPLKTGSAIKITIAKYYTPNGTSIQAKGILPDYIAEDPADISDTPVVKTFESSFKNHLENEKDNNGQKTSAKSFGFLNKIKSYFQIDLHLSQEQRLTINMLKQFNFFKVKP